MAEVIPSTITRRAKTRNLPEEEEDCSHTKKRRIVQGNQLRNNRKANSTIVPHLHGTALTLSVLWLPPRDLLSCIQVCRSWSKDIHMIWYEAAQSATPELVRILEATRYSARSSSNNSNNKNDYYKRVVMGCIGNPGLPNCDLANSTSADLREQDVVLVLQMEENQQSCSRAVGTICYELPRLPVSSEENVLDTGNKLDLRIPTIPCEHCNDTNIRQSSSSSSNTIPLVPDSIFENLVFTIRLFRCDSGESICLAYRKRCDNRDFNSSFFWTDSICFRRHHDESEPSTPEWRLQLCLGCCIGPLPPPTTTTIVKDLKPAVAVFSLNWIGISAFESHHHSYGFPSMAVPCSRDNLISHLNQMKWK
eukprot:scaffold7414_cov116-Cylindrotheca_fusiformis.AAC.2